MIGPFLAPCLRIWLFSGLDLAPWQKIDLATLTVYIYASASSESEQPNVTCIKLRWCLAVNWSHASIIPVNFRKPILYHVKAGFTCTVVILQPM